MNEKDIFVLKNKEAVQISLQQGTHKINISNGYHYVEPIWMDTAVDNVKGYQIDTYFDNFRIGYLIFITLALFFTSWIIKSTLLQILANLPVLAVCAYIIWDKKDFLLMHPLNYTALSCRG